MGRSSSMRPSVIFLAILAARCMAASSTFSASCYPDAGITAFPACNSFLDRGNTCSVVQDRPHKQQCLCNQDYFNMIIACEGEMQRCFEGHDLDSTFEEGIASWHALCDSFVSSQPTTAAPSSITEFPEDYCRTIVQSACYAVQTLHSNCVTSITSDIDRLSSCFCQPQALRLDYTCDFIGNKSCLQTGATLSSLFAYSCANFAEVIGTGLPADTTPTATGGELSASSVSPGLSTSPVPTPTSTKSSSGAIFGLDIVSVALCEGFLFLLHKKWLQL